MTVIDARSLAMTLAAEDAVFHRPRAAATARTHWRWQSNAKRSEYMTKARRMLRLLEKLEDGR